MARRGGWRRRGRKSRFWYEDADGEAVRDEAALERVESLAIPPAWKDVWISPNPRAKLQATGEDAAGRRQYLYHPDFRAAQELKKFDRLVGFGERLPDLRRQMVGHLDLEPYERDWTSAVALSFVNRAWFRAGSERRRSNVRTYGVTTLCKRHATVRGDRVTFRFRGKGRVLVRSTVADTGLADAVRALLDFPGGSRLFRYERDGEAALLTAPILNEYVSEHMGNGFTTKDFRTWGARSPRPSPWPSTSLPRRSRTSAASSPPSCAASARSSGTPPRSPEPRTSALPSSSNGAREGCSKRARHATARSSSTAVGVDSGRRRRSC